MPGKNTTTVYIHTALCKGVDGCGLCMHVCPAGVFDAGELNERGVRPPEITRLSSCTGCGQCMLFCPDMAVVVDVEPARS